MKKIKRELKIEKSKFPDSGKYVLWLHVFTEKGDCWRGIFKGNKKECVRKKYEILHC